MTNINQSQLLLANLDFDKHDNLKDVSCFYLLNGDITDYGNSNQTVLVQNTASNELCVQLPSNYQLVGELNLDKNNQVLFLKNELTSAIYLLDKDTCAIKEIVTSNCLNFQSEYWITGKYKFINDKRRIYFTDGINPVRYLDIDEPYPRVNPNSCKDCNQLTTEELDCNALNFWKCKNIPKASFSRISGNIPNGVYQIAIATIDGDSVTSEYFIFDEVLKLHSNTKSRFGIKVNFECFDTKTETYRIVLITNREDRGTSAQIIGTFTSDQQEVVITDLDNTRFIPITTEELLHTEVYYDSAKFIETNSEVLVLGGLTEKGFLHYQPQANQIKSEWQIVKVKSEDAHKVPSFMSDEVYPFEIEWLYCNGQSAGRYHIPNAVELYPEWEVDVTGKDGVTLDCTSSYSKYWEVYNTAIPSWVGEENDDGSQITSTAGASVSCGNLYGFTGENTHLTWEYSYDSCEQIRDPNNPLNLIYDNVTEYNILTNAKFCSPDINSVDIKDTWVFDKQTDLVDMGPCDPANTNSTCRKWRLNSRFKGVHGTIVFPNECTDAAGSLFCTLPPKPTYVGDLGYYTTHSFCACNPDLLEDQYIEFDITVTVTLPLVVSLGPCPPNPGLDQSETNGVCDLEVVARGQFAYWESNIKYPNNDSFVNLPFKNPKGLCETGIKFHKFPDRTQTWLDPVSGKYKKLPHIHNSTKDCRSREYVYVLTVGFNNITAPVDCNGNPVKDIAGYRIHVGDRSTNKSILHKGMIYNMREEKLSDCTTSLFPNYPYNDLGKDPFIGTKGFVKEASGTYRANDYTGIYKPLDKNYHDRFQYISPNTQFAELEGDATDLYTYAEENGYVEGEFQEEERFPKITLLSWDVYAIINGIILLAAATGFFSGLGTNFTESIINVVEKLLSLFRDGVNGVNYALRQVLYSNYSRFNREKIVIGNRRRRIELSSFLQSSKQMVNGEKINNFQRENGIYLKLNEELDTPYLVEKSRIKMGEPINSRPVNDVNNPEGTCSIYFGDCTQEELRTSSYYVGLKKYNPSQYGNLNDFVTRPITGLSKDTSVDTIYGGDIYITKHAYLRKFPFFTSLPLDLPNETPFNLTQYANIGYPKFYVNNDNQSDLISLVTKGIPGVDGLFNILNSSPYDHYLDDIGEPKKKECGYTDTNCEGSLIFREDGRFYTHIMAIANYYCESEFIGEYREVNEYFFSSYYPLKGKEDFGKYKFLETPESFLYNFQMLSQGVLGKTQHVSLTKDCCTKNDTSDTRVIFSLKHDNQKYKDSWLNFRPLNYHQFDSHDGNLTTIHGINDYNLLFSFENNTYVTQADDGLITQNGNTVYLGAGSIFQRRMKKISSDENGLGGSIDRYSFVNTPYGVYWVDRIRKAFCAYTNTFENITGGIQSWSNEFLNWEVIGSYDPYSKNVYWTGKDNWTISYKPEAKHFISFHSWLPERYVRERYNILTYKAGGLWKHNMKNNYQTFYGQLHPFDIGYNINTKFVSNILQSLSVYAEFLTNVGYGAKVYNQNKFFNKILLYNDYISTGLKNLNVKNLEDPNQSVIQYDTQTNLEVTNMDNNIFNINGFENVASGQPLINWEQNGIKYKPINVNEQAVEFKNNNLRGTYVNVHLINDVYSQYKILCKLSLELIDKINQ